jgi:hypothetical protein
VTCCSGASTGSGRQLQQQPQLVGQRHTYVTVGFRDVRPGGARARANTHTHARDRGQPRSPAPSNLTQLTLCCFVVSTGLQRLAAIESVVDGISAGRLRLRFADCCAPAHVVASRPAVRCRSARAATRDIRSDPGGGGRPASARARHFRAMLFASSSLDRIRKAYRAVTDSGVASAQDCELFSFELYLSCNPYLVISIVCVVSGIIPQTDYSPKSIRA